MKKRSPTSFDVAREAGVSRSTVSLVLNDVRSVAISEETRKKVFEAAEALKYVPHAAGKALASQKTKNIGFVYTDSQASHSFLLQFMQGLALTARDRDLRLLTDTYKEEESFEALVSLIRAQHIDGVIMTEPRIDDPILHQIAAEGFPVVLIGSLPFEPLCSIDIDNVRAAESVVRHLVDRGHTRIGCITNAPLKFSAASSRLEGCRNALEQAGISPNEDYFEEGNYTAESGLEAMRAILQRSEEPPSAVFVASDTVAFGAMRAVRDAGLTIPHDLAVAGFDDIPLSAYTDPPLTTVHFPAVEEGSRAAELLIDLIEGKLEPGYRETVETRLIVRESTASSGPR